MPRACKTILRLLVTGIEIKPGAFSVAEVDGETAIATAAVALAAPSVSSFTSTGGTYAVVLE